jgi:hypothetical protein
MAKVDLKEYIDKISEADKKAVNVALIASEKAVDKAEANTRDWQKTANEWRGAMNDRERDFLTRKEFYTMIVTAVTVITLVIAFFKLVVK